MLKLSWQALLFTALQQEQMTIRNNNNNKSLYTMGFCYGQYS